MQYAFLGRSSSWRVNATAEILRSNLILELGLAKQKFEVLGAVQDLFGDGSIAPAEGILHISLATPSQDSSAISIEEETSRNIYLAVLAPFECTDTVNVLTLLGYLRPPSRYTSARHVVRFWS